MEVWRRTSRSCSLITRWAPVARLSVASRGLSHPPHHPPPHHAHVTLTSTLLLASVDLHLTHGLEVPPHLLTCSSELCHLHCIALGTDVVNASVLPWRCHLHPATVNNLTTIAVFCVISCTARIDSRVLHQDAAVNHMWIMLYALL